MTDELLVTSARELLTDVCTPAAQRTAEQTGWAAGVWEAVSAAGFPGIGVAEELGGSGGTLADALAVLRVAGELGAPVPLAEAGVLGGWLVTGSGVALDDTMPSDDAVLTVAPGRPEDTLHVDASRPDGGRLLGTAHRVPWGRRADLVAALVRGDGGWQVATFSPAGPGVRVEPATNLAGEPRDTLVLDGAQALTLRPAADGVDPDALRLRGALSRVALSAGALAAMSRLTLRYTSERHQFGRPVRAFQAVQQHLVVGAQQAALVQAALDGAAAASSSGDVTAAAFEVAAAKVLAGEASHLATRAAHQAHGAMGMTQEYPLHHLSRRLWAWRPEYGDERTWAARLGRSLTAAGADLLYPAVTGGSSVVALAPA